MRRDDPDGDTGPEVWHLEHPRHGVLEYAVGGPDQLRTLDPDYPAGKKGAKDDSSKDRKPKADSPKVDSPVDDGSEAGNRVDDGSEADDSRSGTVTNPGFVLLRDGAVVARAHQIGDHKVSITGDPPSRGKFTTGLSAVSGPRVQIRSSAFATSVRQVTFRDGQEVVHFDPPPGSAAEARLESIAASPWKRVVYPMAAGVGKAGWAIAAIVLLPLLGRILEPVLDWLLGFIPDVEIPWPDISLPSIPWPEITLPSIDLPDVTVPDWVEFLLEHSRVWVPLVIGVAIAVVAVRHSQRSRRIRAQWESEQNARPVGDSESAPGTDPASAPDTEPGTDSGTDPDTEPGADSASGPERPGDA